MRVMFFLFDFKIFLKVIFFLNKKLFSLLKSLFSQMAVKHFNDRYKLFMLNRKYLMFMLLAFYLKNTFLHAY